MNRHRVGLVVAALLVVAACGDDCPGSATSCLPYGTYVELNPALGTMSATICFDDDCQTVTPNAAGDGPSEILKRTDWQDGRKFELSIEVHDATGAVVGSLSEARSMDSGGCACGVLYYRWRDSELYRLN